MDLDWCTQENINEFQLFNDNSIIKHKLNDKGTTKKNTYVDQMTQNKMGKDLNVNDCFSLDLETKDKLKILEILNYLSFVSNNLRTIIRNKNLVSGFDYENFNNLIKYLEWLKSACENMKKHFNCSKKRENINDGIFRPFKTSSYKFCNYKNSCSIHKNKNKLCDKNHFVFEMVIADIDKLIESLNKITNENLDYLNWVFSDGWIKITVDENSNLTIEKFENIENIQVENINIHFINKNILFKCFDVISYVLNKMFEEALNFLTYDIESLQINL